jgi:hypothetical protein
MAVTLDHAWSVELARGGQLPEHRILEPLEVTAGGRRLNQGRRRQRPILAALLVRASQVVPLDELLAAGRGDSPPATARRQGQSRIGDLCSG